MSLSGRLAWACSPGEDAAARAQVGRLSAISSFRLYPACYDPTGQTSHKLDPESEWAQEEFAAVHDCLKNQFNIKNNQGLFTDTVCHVYWAIHRSAKTP